MFPFPNHFTPFHSLLPINYTYCLYQKLATNSFHYFSFLKPFFPCERKISGLGDEFLYQFENQWAYGHNLPIKIMWKNLGDPWIIAIKLLQEGKPSRFMKNGKDNFIFYYSLDFFDREWFNSHWCLGTCDENTTYNYKTFDNSNNFDSCIHRAT